jgi:hypothetical protein
MKLIQEANNDDKLATQLGKIQKAIEAIEKLLPDLKLTSSQRTSLKYAAEDLARLVRQ